MYGYGNYDIGAYPAYGNPYSQYQQYPKYQQQNVQTNDGFQPQEPVDKKREDLFMKITTVGSLLTAITVGVLAHRSVSKMQKLLGGVTSELRSTTKALDSAKEKLAAKAVTTGSEVKNAETIATKAAEVAPVAKEPVKVEPKAEAKTTKPAETKPAVTAPVAKEPVKVEPKAEARTTKTKKTKKGSHSKMKNAIASLFGKKSNTEQANAIVAKEPVKPKVTYITDFNKVHADRQKMYDDLLKDHDFENATAKGAKTTKPAETKPVVAAPVAKEPVKVEPKAEAKTTKPAETKPAVTAPVAKETVKVEPKAEAKTTETKKGFFSKMKNAITSLFGKKGPKAEAKTTETKKGFFSKMKNAIASLFGKKSNTKQANAIVAKETAEATEAVKVEPKAKPQTTLPDFQTILRNEYPPKIVLPTKPQMKALPEHTSTQTETLVKAEPQTILPDFQTILRNEYPPKTVLPTKPQMKALPEHISSGTPLLDKITNNGKGIAAAKSVGKLNPEKYAGLTKEIDEALKNITSSQDLMTIQQKVDALYVRDQRRPLELKIKAKLAELNK